MFFFVCLYFIASFMFYRTMNIEARRNFTYKKIKYREFTEFMIKTQKGYYSSDGYGDFTVTTEKRTGYSSVSERHQEKDSSRQVDFSLLPYPFIKAYEYIDGTKVRLIPRSFFDHLVITVMLILFDRRKKKELLKENEFKQ